MKLWTEHGSLCPRDHRAAEADEAALLELMRIMAEKSLVRRNAKERAHVQQVSSSRELKQKQIAVDLLAREPGECI